MAENPATNGAPALNALAQYCKDFSFENPNAPRSLQQQTEGPQINLQVN
ncbi:MAG: protein-export chaperone SecB, partial [Microvirga sp.]